MKDDAQIIKGQMQKIKGKVQEKVGHPIQGAVSKMQGEANIIAEETKRDVDKEPTNADVV
ncbi:MAG TPA: hypothetical protein VLF89_05620 [Candidatus Saccharimonadales bacterium]|nr:hypothetical protein [Candidatus Saccharimonadales bacterium]